MAGARDLPVASCHAPIVYPAPGSMHMGVCELDRSHRDGMPCCRLWHVGVAKKPKHMHGKFICLVGNQSILLEQLPWGKNNKSWSTERKKNLHFHYAHREILSGLKPQYCNFFPKSINLQLTNS
jgi:hypothetical protein